MYSNWKGMFILKRRQLLPLIITFVFVVLVLGLCIQAFIPKKVISVRENVTISRVLYHGAEISTDKNELINILNKYNAKRSLQKYFPYQGNDTDIEIDIIDNHKPKHILLGKFNIWYVSGDKGAYDILNAQQLKDELNNILGQDF
jgi:hypothetical protein